jgi:hypothetical protein
LPCFCCNNFILLLGDSPPSSQLKPSSDVTELTKDDDDSYFSLQHRKTSPWHDATLFCFSRLLLTSLYIIIFINCHCLDCCLNLEVKFMDWAAQETPFTNHHMQLWRPALHLYSPPKGYGLGTKLL